jgi:hypothetical protein
MQGKFFNESVVAEITAKKLYPLKNSFADVIGAQKPNASATPRITGKSLL